MTTADFLRVLADIGDQFDWSLKADISPQSERRRTPRLHLLATSARQPGVWMGPLQAVCYSRTGQLHSIDVITDAAEILEMDPAEASDIIAASNDQTWQGAEGSREPVERLITIRRQLLEAVRMMTQVS